ncbi:bifunctional diaminohydroxyphosphoribosylaminopyrimidine deaminase/5-amino-6-(5-phosphoribosylamino)uracil reductase RibD [Candidatus Berkiella aquae]|uniref:Riboflavin biosynthesis protein RibD n=1 Tax=Candidatus Berkiella aquae TaxID=295108 RepID=A0A0Q9YMJ8_9GAMM|nr:bifunctional diaminohydroxyphosphoribosylaminopyrimidine deaminase/5-amino-6-(5-phosphoribosylamino)uracil reductase RibD [Candidatus Berkiella aquae]MCS5710331.1 bifunctional diaminohydroxyphosphoribosylaminopyrimidine deaminase/5-amino-6-(5-phosphoribosylamino)uracil reductase RibD [Candidatus Berkiella aquae]
MSNNIDEMYMRQAIHLAKQGEYGAKPNPMVGCVIVANQQIVGEGCHLQYGQAHAEIHALQQAKELAKGATLYVTLEPCAHTGKTGPCVNAVIQAGIKHVVIAAGDPNPQVNGKGVQLLQEAGILVTQGVLTQEAKALNPGFYSRFQRSRPYVRAKLGMSFDGKIAMKTGESQWITSTDARADVQKWRARSCAIVTTAATVIQDDCRLTVRDIPGAKQPLRILFDTQLKTPQSSQIFSQAGKTVVAVSCTKHTSQAISAWQNKVQGEVECIALSEENEHVDFNALLAWLTEKTVNEVMIEAGAQFVGALLEKGLIDELLVYVAPKLLGNNSISMAHLPSIHQLNENIQGKYLSIDKIGTDARFRIAISDFARRHHDHS